MIRKYAGNAKGFRPETTKRPLSGSRNAEKKSPPIAAGKTWDGLAE